MRPLAKQFNHSEYGGSKSVGKRGNELAYIFSGLNNQMKSHKAIYQKKVNS